VSPIDLSVIICTCNRAPLLTDCLAALTQQRCAQYSFETIVVDNGSTDRTRHVVQSLTHSTPEIRYLYEREKGLSHARNVGFQASRGRYVAYLDDDAVPNPAWCSSICGALEASGDPLGTDIGAIGGPVEPVFEGGRPPWLTQELEPLYVVLDLGSRVRSFPQGRGPVGANMAFPAIVLRENPWDDSLLMWEDGEMLMRLLGKGLRFLYVPGMRVRHFIPISRLKPEWLVSRYFYDGIAAQRVLPRFGRRWRMAATALVRFPSCWVRSRIGPRRSRLFRKCLSRWFCGYLTGLMGLKRVHSAPYLSRGSETPQPTVVA
jgi:glycosyltransferase involved in cell wall biosynthesis